MRYRQITSDERYMISKLRQQQFNPSQIAHLLGRHRRSGTWTISHETIYAHIWHDKRRGGQLFRELRCATKRRRKRHGTYDSRGRLAGKRAISERPCVVDHRTELGHWEVDTVVGVVAPDCVATLVERKSGFTLLGKLRNRTSRGMTQRLRWLMRRAPQAFKTVTADNGTEFHDYQAVEATTGVTVYFATPYHWWERGTNENLDGLLRQYLPKRISLAGLTQRHCDALALRLNTRPRKRLGYRTPEECFNER